MQTIPPISTLLEKINDHSIEEFNKGNNEPFLSELILKSNEYSYPMKANIKKRSPFTEIEDRFLEKLVEKYGTNWTLISGNMHGRSPRQCRDRWNNYLCPEINQAPWTKEEERLLFQKYYELGPQWKLMTSFFYHRSYNAIRNKFISMTRKMTGCQCL